MAVFGEKRSCRCSILVFVTPKRHILAQNRVFWRILRWCPWWRHGCRWFLEPPKNSRVNIARKRNPLSDLNKILQGGRYPRRNHLRKFWWRSVKGFRGGGGQNLLFSTDFDRRPYNTLAQCVISSSDLTNEGNLCNMAWRSVSIQPHSSQRCLWKATLLMANVINFTACKQLKLSSFT